MNVLAHGSHDVALNRPETSEGSGLNYSHLRGGEGYQRRSPARVRRIEEQGASGTIAGASARQKMLSMARVGPILSDGVIAPTGWKRLMKAVRAGS